MSFRGISILAVCLLTDAGVTANAQKPDEILVGVKDIVAPGGIPGDFVVFGEKASVLLCGNLGKAKLPMLAVADYGRGRVAALGHEAFFGGAGLKNAGNRQLTQNLINWTGRKPLATLRISLVGQDVALRDLLKGKGANVSEPAPQTLTVALAKTDVLFLNQASLDGAKFRKTIVSVREWVGHGGGLVISGPAWGWQSVNGGRDLAREHSGNQILLPMGIAFAGGMLDSSDKSGYPIGAINSTKSEDLSLTQANTALMALEAQSAGTRILTPQELEQVTTTLGEAVGALPSDHNGFVVRVEKLCEDRGGNLIPTRATPITRTAPFARLKATLDLQRSRKLPPEQIKAHPSAASFPGSVPADAKRETRTVSIDTHTPEWHGTGLYAAPGEVVTLTLPREAVGKGLSVRIGAHTDTLWHLAKWERFPEVSLTKPLDAETVKVASPFGGAIFVVVPENGSLGTISVTISNAVAAPRFVRGVTSKADWQTLSNAPAPWAELEGKLVVLTVPASAIRDLDDPEALMTYWDEVLEKCYAFYAAPKRNRPERYCVDREISAGYMHSGYPIMTGDDVAKTFCDVMVLRGSSGIKCWGFYHEMGHNFQQPEWTWEDFGEVTNNLFSLYGTEMLNGVTIGAHPAMTAAEIEKRVAIVKANPGAKAYYAQDPWFPLTMFSTLQKRFGWGAFTRLFTEFRDLPATQRPRTEAEKRDQFLVRFSRIIGHNLTGYLKAWGVETSAAAQQKVADLPAWTFGE